MRNKEKDAYEMAIKRQTILEKSFQLFSSEGIEPVSYLEISKVCGYGTTTLHRYYSTKPKLVVAVAAWKWEQFQEENKERRPNVDFSSMTAAGILEYYLESFIELYKHHKDLLQFNQFFNAYAKSERIDTGTMQPYQSMIGRLKERFHMVYVKAEQDKTVRTDVPEEEMFSKILHVMLAVVTRYAVGLVYIPEKGFDPEKELLYVKELLLRDYRLSESVN